ncbi:MAG: Lrp/AsnC family transcriptional regulator [Pseudomonadota bacterium]
MDFDQHDERLLELLQEDARAPLDSLAHDVGLSVASVGRRLTRLRKEGVITKEVAIVDPAKVGRAMTFIVAVELIRENASELMTFRQTLQSEPLVQQFYYVTGEADFILIVRAANMTEFEELSERLFLQANNVRRFRTSISLSNAGITTQVKVGDLPQ